LIESFSTLGSSLSGKWDVALSTEKTLGRAIGRMLHINDHDRLTHFLDWLMVDMTPDVTSCAYTLRRSYDKRYGGDVLDGTPKVHHEMMQVMKPLIKSREKLAA